MARAHGTTADPEGVRSGDELEVIDPTFDPEPEAEEGPDWVPVEDVQSTLTRQLERAQAWFEERVEPDLKRATDYYHGRPFGDEEKGRSRVVSTDLKDSVRGLMPSLMRIFFGPETVVEFRPRKPGSEEGAKQATDAVNYIVREKNEGYLIFWSVMKDALVRRLGILKWGVDEVERTETREVEGLTQDQILFLMEQPDLEVEAHMGDSPGGEQLFGATVTRRTTEPVHRVWAVPPEEFRHTPSARSIDEAPLVAHSREVAASELAELGIDPDLIREHQGRRYRVAEGGLEDARRVDGGGDIGGEEEELHESQSPVLFTEAYLRISVREGDLRAELRKFWCVGPDYTVVNGDGYGEVVDEVPFALFSPDPEPHTITGLSLYDDLKDIQRVKSQVIRALLNSFALTIDPRTEVVMGEVNMDDLLNKEMGNLIRVRRPGQLREIRHEFVGAAALPVLAYYDELMENATGRTKAAMGLDADALQSSTKAAVAATLTAGQQRAEIIARNFAETGMRRLFRGLLRQIARHPNPEMMIRLRGKFEPVDPRYWDADMDVEINVALGSGTSEEKAAILGAVLEKQEQLIEQGAPIVTLVEYRATLGRFVELAGLKDSAQFFRPWGPEEQGQHEQEQAQQEPPPDPALLLVEVEREKVQNAKAEGAQRMQFEMAKLQLEAERMRRQDDRERDKIARDFALKMEELKLKGAAAEVDAVRVFVQEDRADQEADFLQEQAEREAQQAQAMQAQAMQAQEAQAMQAQEAQAMQAQQVPPEGPPPGVDIAAQGIPPEGAV